MHTLLPYPRAAPFHEVLADDFALLVRLLVGLIMVAPPVAATTILSESPRRQGGRGGRRGGAGRVGTKEGGWGGEGRGDTHAHVLIVEVVIVVHGALHTASAPTSAPAPT